VGLEIDYTPLSTCADTAVMSGGTVNTVRQFLSLKGPFKMNIKIKEMQFYEAAEINPLNAELNPICYLLALLAHHFLHVSSVRVKSLTLRLLMSYIYIWSAYS